MKEQRSDVQRATNAKCAKAQQSNAESGGTIESGAKRDKRDTGGAMM